MDDKNKVINAWEFGSKDAMEVADSLYTSNKYNFCLFFCHLALEKKLKAIVVNVTDDAAPFTHKLVELANLSQLPFSQEQKDDLNVITEFNLEARYEEYKLEFYKKATKEYCDIWYAKTKELLLWASQH